MATRSGAIKAHLNEFLTVVRAVTEHVRGAVRRVLPQPSDTVLVLLREVSNPQETEEAQVKDQQSPVGDGGEKLRGKAFIIGRGLLRIELPERAMGKGFDHHPPPSGQDEAGLSLQCLGLFPNRCPESTHRPWQGAHTARAPPSSSPGGGTAAAVGFAPGH